MARIIPPHLIKDYERKFLPAVADYSSNLFTKLLFIILLLTLSGTNIVGQAVIKERVKIEPKIIYNKTETINPDTSGYTPCGPWISSTDYYNRWQVVWRYSQYDLVVQHQPFNYQANVYNSVITGNFSIEITEGNGICEILELLPDPSIENGYYYKVAPDILESVTLADAGGGIADSLLMWIQGVPSAHHAGFIRYTIHFTGTGDVTYNITENGETISYHTRVVEPTFYMDYDTVYVNHGEYADVYYKPKPLGMSRYVGILEWRLPRSKYVVQ